ncbi:MAG: anti-sigma factor [Chloroflexota bacterium]|nr:anti-sigma factor [Chloroflexota bacterium]
MNSQYAHDNDLVGAYALDALEAADRASFEEHLLGCAACRAELADLYQVVAVLPLSVEMVEPPAELRSRITAAIEAESPVRPALKLVAGAAPARRPRSRLTNALALLSVAAALVIAALGVTDLRLQQRVDQQQADLTYQHDVSAAIASGAPVMRIHGTPVAPGASAALIQPANGKSAYMIVKGLPVTPANKVYQLWLIRGERPHSATTFTVSGNGTQIIHLPSAVTGYAQTALTVEPSGGSRLPTGKLLLTGRLSA